MPAYDDSCTLSQAMNKYGVKVSGPGGTSNRPKLSGGELLCQLKQKVEVATLTADLHPFSSLAWAPLLLPPQQLTSDIGPYKSCAVVSSAGSLRNSGLGKEIGEARHPNCAVKEEFRCICTSYSTQQLKENSLNPLI